MTLNAAPTAPLASLRLKLAFLFLYFLLSVIRLFETLGICLVTFRLFFA